MKKKHALCIWPLLITVIFFSFRDQNTKGSVRGRVVPYNAALNVWIVSDTDTARTTILSGAFFIKGLKAGKYRIIVEGRKPYRITTKTEVMINGGSTTDVGDIILDQDL